MSLEREATGSTSVEPGAAGGNVRLSPVQVERCSDAKSETDVAIEIVASLVDEQLNFELMCSMATEKPQPGGLWGPRPARLENSLPDGGQASFSGSKHRDLIKPEAHELPVFRHLAALEEAVRSGEALAGNIPELPTNLKRELNLSLGNEAPQEMQAWEAHVAGVTATIQSARGLDRTRMKSTTGTSMPLRSTGGGLLAKAPVGYQNQDFAGLAGRSPRFFFSDDGYGMQPPLLPGSRKHAAAPSTGFGCSALRGAPLQQCRRGPHATALWVSSEKVRLRSEVVKPFGSSAAIAFIQNGGPQRSLEPLQQALCDQELV